MALWGKTDAVGSRPKWINLLDLSVYPEGTQVIFVDETEAQAAANKARGINTPGWYLYRSYLDSAGVTRHKAEMLVELSVAAADSGDATADDRTILISAQPADASADTGTGATFSVTAAATPTASLSYQWEVSTDGGSNWADATGGVYSGDTTATLTISDVTGLDAYEYRVVISATGASDVTSSAATLTETTP